MSGASLLQPVPLQSNSLGLESQRTVEAEQQHPEQPSQYNSKWHSRGGHCRGRLPEGCCCNVFLHPKGRVEVVVVRKGRVCEVECGLQRTGWEPLQRQVEADMWQGLSLTGKVCNQ
eukprot:EG_transcript_50931